MDYASSGVDIDAEGAAIASLIESLSGSVRKPGTRGAPVPLPGGFGGIIEFGDSCLALATDGVGSKLQLANQLGRYQGVGIAVSYTHLRSPRDKRQSRMPSSA